MAGSVQFSSCVPLGDAINLLFLHIPDTMLLSGIAESWPALESRLDMHQAKKRMAQMKPSCCSSISRLLRTFLSIRSMVFGVASGVSSSSIGAGAGAEGTAKWVGENAGITPGGFPRTSPYRSGCSAKRSRCPGPQVGSGAAEL